MKDLSKTVLISVDGGGTRCRAAVGTAFGGILARAEGGPANAMADFDGAVANIKAAVKEAADSAGTTDALLSRATAHIGLAGVLSDEDGERIKTALCYGATTVTDDRVTAVAGAFAERDGFLVSLGTGSFLAVQNNKDIKFLGGWGFHIGDQASGAWLGRKAMERVLECYDGIVPDSDLTLDLFEKFQNDPVAVSNFSFSATPRDFGAFAQTVIAAAKAEDPHANALIMQGARYIQASLDALGFQNGDPICFIGGIGASYCNALTDGTLSGLRAPAGTALDGGFMLARDAALLAARYDV